MRPSCLLWPWIQGYDSKYCVKYILIVGFNENVRVYAIIKYDIFVSQMGAILGDSDTDDDDYDSDDDWDSDDEWK